MQWRGGRPDNGRGWEGRKQRREAWRVGVGGERRGRGRALGRGGAMREERVGIWGEKRRDEAERVRILGVKST